MKVSLLAGVSAIAFASSAFAADLPSRKSEAMAPVAAPMFTWTGGYVGANGGYAWGSSTMRAVLGGSWIGDPDNAGVTAAGYRKLQPASAIFGVQGGYNYQMNSLVVGVEADASYLGLKSSYATGVLNAAAPVTGTYSGAGSVSSNWLLSLRPRIGVAVDNVLIYATGGLAIADDRFSQTLSYLNVAVIGLPVTTVAGGANAGKASSTKVGWTLGGGAEWAFAKNWSVKAEYLYANLGRQGFSSSYTSVTPLTYTATHRDNLSLSIARVGVNYHF